VARRAALIVAGLASITVTLAGCAQPGYDAAKIERQLVQAGATPVQARCVLSGLDNTFDVNQLASHSDPTAKESATTRALLQKCGITNLRPSAPSS
jgi:outer membrane murein-binding lipoprotein Lpp